MRFSTLLLVITCVTITSCNKTDILPRGISITKTTYGGDNSTYGDYASSIAKTEDGGAIITGSTWSNTNDFLNFQPTLSDIYIMKLNSRGEKEWIKTYGGSGYDNAFSIITTNDGGYLLTGFSSSSDGDFANHNFGKSDIIIMKLTSSGEIQWIRNFGSSSDSFQWGQCAIQTKDGDYVIAGATRYSDDGDFIGLTKGEGDIAVIKLNSAGETIWLRVFGGSGQDRTFAMTEIQDGSYVITGTTESRDGDFNNKGLLNAFIIKVSPEGEKVWARTLGGSNVDLSYGIAPTNDGGFVITGQRSSSDGDFSISRENSFKMIYVTKLTSAGEITWTRLLYGGRYGGYTNSIIQTHDGGFVALGSALSDKIDFRGPIKSGAGILIFKLNPEGRAIWTDTYETYTDYGSSICQINNGNYIVTGYATSNNFLNTKILILLYNFNGLKYLGE